MGQVRKLDVERRARAPKPDPEAAATVRLAKAIEAMNTRLGPAADAIVGFENRLDLLCKWLKKWGPWVLGTAPIILSLVGGSSVEVGKMAAAFLKAWAN